MDRPGGSRTLLERTRFWAFIGAWAFPLLLSAQEMPVPLHIQYPIFLKALTFDRMLKARSGSEISLGILYQSGFRHSLDAKDELIEYAADFPVQSIDGLSIHLIPIDLSHTSDIAEAFSRANVHLLYVLPLRAVSLQNICTITREKKILTLTGVPEYVAAGVSVGIDVTGQHPSLLINITASREEGADLDSQLLNLARIVH